MTGRALGGPTRYAARASTRGIRSKIQRVAASLTSRDQLICVDLHEHRVLTTQHLFELHFSSIQRARSRLSRLHQLGVLWRSRPRTQFGSLPWHYTLDQLGAQIVAETLGIELKAVGYREDRKRTLVDMAAARLGSESRPDRPREMGAAVTDMVAAALIAAVASVIGSALTFIVGIRSLRRSVSTSNGEPLGRALEGRLDRVERRLDGMERSISEVREWLAFREGRERPLLWTPPQRVMTRQASSVEMALVSLPRLLTVRELADLLQVPPKDDLHLARQGHRTAGDSGWPIPPDPSRGPCRLARGAGPFWMLHASFSGAETRAFAQARRIHWATCGARCGTAWNGGWTGWSDRSSTCGSGSPSAREGSIRRSGRCVLTRGQTNHEGLRDQRLHITA